MRRPLYPVPQPVRHNPPALVPRSNTMELRVPRWPPYADTYAQTILGDSPTLYWRLNDPIDQLHLQGSVMSQHSGVVDISGFGHHGTIHKTGDGTFTRNITGALVAGDGVAVQLDPGTSAGAGGANIGGNDGYDGETQLPGQGEYGPYTTLQTTGTTTEGWFYDLDPASVTNKFLISGSGSFDPKVRLSADNDTLTLMVVAETETWTSLSMAWTTNAWHHFVMRYNLANSTVGELPANTVEPFLDGLSLGQRTVTTNPISSEYLLVGWDGSGVGEGWGGYVDEIACYESVLSTAQIQEHYTVGSGELPKEIPYLIQRPLVPA